MDRVALVTGAAGGVGRDLVARLRAGGYRVVAVDIAPTVMDLAEPDATVPVHADIRDDDVPERAVSIATSQLGRLDLLVNNAGRFLRRPITRTTDEDFDELFAINVRAAFRFARAALPALARSRGCLVNVASISGLIGLVDQSVYAMTKGALVQLTRQLAIEYAPHGVRVNAVAPGAIDTDFTAAARREDPDPAASLATTLANHPLGRMSTADEVAAAIAFLAGPEASAITGAVLCVDGGYTAR